MSRKVTVSLNFEIHFYFGLALCVDMGPARRLSSAPVKRRSGASTQTTRLFSQRGPADPSVTFFKLGDHNSLPDCDPEAGRGPLASPGRRSKRVKIDIVNTEGTASCCGDDEDDEELPGQATKAPTGKGKGKGKYEFGHCWEKSPSGLHVASALGQGRACADEDAERDNMELGRKMMMTRQ